MTRKEERILSKATKVGLKTARREGHVPSKDELLELKIQVLPAYGRWLLVLGALLAGVASWLCWNDDHPVTASVLAVVSVLLLVFAIFGVRRTLGELANHAAFDLPEIVIKALIDAVGDVI